MIISLKNQFLVFLSGRLNQVLLYFNCLLAVMLLLVFCDFLVVPWFGLLCMIMAFPGYTFRLNRRQGKMEANIHHLVITLNKRSCNKYGEINT